MITPSDRLLAYVIHLLLILTRVSSIFILSPVLGRNNVPAALKIGFSLLVSFIIINIYPPPLQYPFDTVLSFTFAILAEMGIGLVIGVITIMFFNLVYTAGHIIDMQMGFAMANFYDASAGAQIPLSGMLLNIMMLQSFILSGGVTSLIMIIGRTFEFIPVGGAVFSPALANVAANTFVKCFTLSLNVAMPVLASALLAEIGLGIIVRTAPQMNVFVVGIPIKIILALVILIILTPGFVTFTGPLFDMMYETIDTVTEGMMPA